MKSHTAAVVVALSALPNALAWGNLGHETIAYIATNFGKKLVLTTLKKGR
jgi:hypothetical protein